MTLNHWTDDKLDYTFFIDSQRIDVKLIDENVVDDKGLPLTSYKVYARHHGVKDWFLISTITEPNPVKPEVKHDNIRSLVRMFIDDMPRLP